MREVCPEVYGAEDLNTPRRWTRQTSAPNKFAGRRKEMKLEHSNEVACMLLSMIKNGIPIQLAMVQELVRQKAGLKVSAPYGPSPT